MSLVVPLEEVFANKTGLLANHESWERIELGTICAILNGFPFKSNLFNKSKGFPVIRIRDIARSATETFYDGDFPPEYIVRKGELLIGMDGNFRCFEWQGCEAGLNQRVCKITADERILLRKFLLYGLNGYLKAIEDVTSSVTVGHLSSRDIQQIPFPLPSLAEQKRIVAKLEKVLEKVDACRTRLDKIPTLLKRFRQSVLAAACSGKLTADWRKKNPDIQPANTLIAVEKPTDDLPNGWTMCAFGEYVENHDGKRVPVSAIERQKRKGSFPYYGASGIIDSIDKFTHDGEFVLIGEDGANLLSRSTPIAFLTKGQIWVNNHAHVLRCRHGFPNAYLCAYINSIDLAPYVTGTAQPKLNQANMNTIPVPVPPLPEQQEIVRRVEELFALADRLEARYAKAKAQIDRLVPSILAKAFRGELVPQNPTDEPASVLLAELTGTPNDRTISAQPSKGIGRRGRPPKS